MRAGKLSRVVYKVTRLTITTFYHSTEDPGKVRKALLNALPKKLREQVRIDEVVTEGHYGNAIGILIVELSGKKALNSFTHIICSLPPIDHQILKATVDNRVGSRPSHVYLRLSKQDAFLRRLTLLDGDDIIKVSATVNGVRRVEDLKEFITDLISNCGEVNASANRIRKQES